MADFKSKIVLAVLLISVAYPGITPVSGAEECTSCHSVRHGLTGNLCDNCHYNTTISDGKHVRKPFSPRFVHESFDWEGDNSREKRSDRLNESCPVCHISMLEHTSQVLNVCEDCHVKEEMKKSRLVFVRKDISNYTPRVYSHYNGSSIDIPDQSALGQTKSSCFGYNRAIGEGSCHGVNFARRNGSGGFYAYNARNYTGNVSNRGDPYHWNAPADAMPDSKDCAFCHLQDNEGMRKAWGNPRALPADSSHINKRSEDCLDCHVDGEFRSFHGKEVVRMVERSSLVTLLSGLLGGLVIIILAIAVMLRRKKR